MADCLIPFYWWEIHETRIRKLFNYGVRMEYCVSGNRARICRPFKESKNRFSARRACTTTLFVVPARRLHGLAKSIPRNRFLVSINIYKYGLWCLSMCMQHTIPEAKVLDEPDSAKPAAVEQLYRPGRLHRLDHG